MNNFRKLNASLPVLVFAILLTGCGGGNSGSGINTDTTTNTDTDTDTDTDNPPVNNAPVADAGVDQAVNDAAAVSLDGSASSDSDSDALTYAWAQTAGMDVALSDASAEAPTFTAPTVAGGTTLTFELTVSDGEASDTDTVTITVNDVIPAVATLAPLSGEALGIRDDIVITFDEAMDPASLTLGGDLGAISDGGTWSAGNTMLTIAPDDLGAWESGDQSLVFSVTDASGNVTDVSALFAIDFVLETFQAAEVVIGQVDFTSRTSTTTASNFSSDMAGGAAYDPATGLLYLPDGQNHRVLGFEGIPESNGAVASLVLGQADFESGGSGTSATTFKYPQSATVSNGKLVVTENGNRRVSIFDPAPQAGPGTIATVVGQADKDTLSTSSCSRSGLYFVGAHFTTPAGKLIVSDFLQHRTMIWNSVPEADGADANLVLGQSDFTNCDEPTEASALRQSSPSVAWSDDEKLVLTDSGFSRILIWNSFPTVNTDEPDIVLGQGDFTHGANNDDDQDGTVDGGGDGTPTARTLYWPYGSAVISNGRQLLVADSGNNRVLVWNSFPTASFQAADVVLGQADFTSRAADDDNQDGTSDTLPSARTFGDWGTAGVVLVRDRLIVTDASNNRYLVFRSK